MTTFKLGDEVAFGGKRMRIAGLAQLEGASGQHTRRYLLADDAGAPVIVEEGDGRYTLLRPLPVAAQTQAAGNAVLVGTEKYTLVGVRKLKLLQLEGQVPGATLQAQLLVSGVFESPAGTLMRELAPGATTQVYYLLKPLGAEGVISAARHEAALDAAGRAAGRRALDDA